MANYGGDNAIMAFLKQHRALLWAIAATISWVCQFLFGSGIWWESARVNLEIGRGLAELYQKKAAVLEDVLRPEMIAAPSDSPVRQVKINYLNAIEKSIAHLEGRPPVLYGRPAAASNARIR